MTTETLVADDVAEAEFKVTLDGLDYVTIRVPYERTVREHMGDERFMEMLTRLFMLGLKVQRET